MYYVNTPWGFVKTVSLHDEFAFTHDLRFAKAFISFTSADTVGKRCVNNAPQELQYFCVVCPAID